MKLKISEEFELVDEQFLTVTGEYKDMATEELSAKSFPFPPETLFPVKFTPFIFLSEISSESLNIAPPY
jgi:hypothetical protein